MNEPVDHILRPRLPWRDESAITECGYDATKVKTLTRADYTQRLKDLGRQRTAMITCMTCADTATRYGTWDDDPRAAVDREIRWEGVGWRRSDQHGVRLRDELLAIAALIDAHREEFLSSVASVGQRREWLARKAAHERQTQQKKQPRGGILWSAPS